MDGHAATQETVTAVWRIESARIIARLTAMVGDVGEAEDLAQDALIAAMQRWPAQGVPENPGAWLMTTARNRAIDALRRRDLAQRRHEEFPYDVGLRAHGSVQQPDAAVDDPIGDDLLRLVFICCHPVLSRDARVALTLRLLGGLTTDEIARAFLVPVPAVSQRIVRAKRTLREARVPFEVPGPDELHERLAAVLDVVYLIFNEGYTATAGDDWFRPALCEEAVRLGRVLAGLAPDEPEVHGLVALMEIQSSRLRARVGPAGEPVLLMDQDRMRWDRLLIRRGLAALDRAFATGSAVGPYTLQAAIAAVHAQATAAADTDWHRIVALYDALRHAAPSPVVELNRAVAVSMASGPEDGLALVDPLGAEPALANYHYLPAVRGDLLFRLGRLPEARREFQRAAALTRNSRERSLLEARAADCVRDMTRPD